jgi:hypothetical protein
MHPIFAYEFCYLQLRLSCELIASACVVAHGDLQIAQTGKMQNEDRAPVILKMLEEAHPNFYPRPTRQILDAAGNVECVTAITSGYLSKEELPKLYAKCGNEIHKGKVKKAGRPINQAVSFKEIGEWRSKIMTLLGHHAISLHDSPSEVWVLMHEKSSGKVHWAFMEPYNP